MREKLCELLSVNIYRSTGFSPEIGIIPITSSSVHLCVNHYKTGDIDFDTHICIYWCMYGDSYRSCKRYIKESLGGTVLLKI